MITPRQSRLYNTPDLPTFQRTIAGCLDGSTPWNRRASVVLVPSRAAADQLRWTLERLVLERDTAVLPPRLLTRDELYAELHRRAGDVAPVLSPIERLVCGRAAADEALASGIEPPFKLRPGLIAEFLALYDELRRRLRTVDAFERLLVEELEPSAELDRGARRMLRQTRFLVAMFRAYQRRVLSTGRFDEHGLRALVLDHGLRRPLYQVVVAVGDRASGPDGLWSGDFDLLARLPDLARIDLVTTASMLDAGFRERLHDLLPGVEETRVERSAAATVRLVTPGEPSGHRYFTFRDREEELLAVIRQVKLRSARERTAVVFQRPLPYLYLAGHLFASAGLPFQTRDTLPLAAEPFAAALDLVLTFVSSGHARIPTVELLRSPHFLFVHHGRPIDPAAVSALDRGLLEARYAGGRDELRRLGMRWRASGAVPRGSPAAAVALVAAALADELDELTRPGPSSRMLDCLLRFLDGHCARAPAHADTASRESRARAAVVGVIRDLRDAHARHDDLIVDLPTVTSMLRRWIEGLTFAAPTGARGVSLVDARAARYGMFDNVFLVGLVDGEWPERTRQSSLYPVSLLIRLGWSREIERLRTVRAGFADLLGLAAGRVSVSTVAFEDDAVVAASAVLEDLDDTGLEATPERRPTARVTIEAGLAEVPDAVPLSGEPAEWLALRVARAHEPDDRYHGAAGPRAPARYAVSAVERYLSCPFKYFASTVLRLGEEPDDELIMTPRSRGRFIHEVFRVFFERWQQSGGGAIDVETLDDARTLARTVAGEHLGGLPARDRAVERVWLLGSAAGMGVVDRLLSLEADRPGRVLERLLEFGFDGVFQLDGQDGPRKLRLRGIADRIDLLEDGRLRVIDYKSGRAPNQAHSLQLPVYGRCAEQELGGRHGTSWRLDEAAYVALGEPRGWVPLERRRDMAAALAIGQARFIEAVDDIERGQFPPRPAQPYRCVFCDYPTVCRKDYVGALGGPFRKSAGIRPPMRRPPRRCASVEYRRVASPLRLRWAARGLDLDDPRWVVALMKRISKYPPAEPGALVGVAPVSWTPGPKVG